MIIRLTFVLTASKNDAESRELYMSWIETEEDAEFIEFIKSYNEQQKPKVIELFEKYSDKNIIILESREQADAFLNGEKL